MATLTFGTTEHSFGYTVDFTFFKLFMIFHKNIAVIGIVREMHLGRAMAIHTPAHGQVAELINHVHVLDGAVTDLTLDFADSHMLLVTEIHKVGQIMNFNPLDGMT